MLLLTVDKECSTTLIDYQPRNHYTVCEDFKKTSIRKLNSLFHEPVQKHQKGPISMGFPSSPLRKQFVCFCPKPVKEHAFVHTVYLTGTRR